MVTRRVVGTTSNRNKIWECICDCGKIINVPSGSLITENTKSCGCLHAESMKIMGESSRILNQYDLAELYGIGFTSKLEPFYFDLEDYDKIKNYTWNYNPEKYVVTQPFGKIIRMHILIMNSNSEKEVDHINHITWDNRKNNLRICERFQNRIHSKTYINNTSGRKGVYWDKLRNKWKAVITYNNKVVNLGRFDVFEEAVYNRELAEVKYHKEFACN